MPRNTNWFMRKYIVQNSKPKHLCQIYRVQLYEQQRIQQKTPGHVQAHQNTSKPIRINKNIFNNQVPIWAEVNERQNFGYAVIPKSPITYFNDHDDGQYHHYEPDQKVNLYSWEHLQTHEEWIQY